MYKEKMKILYEGHHLYKKAMDAAIAMDNGLDKGYFDIRGYLKYLDWEVIIKDKLIMTNFCKKMAVTYN